MSVSGPNVGLDAGRGRYYGPYGAEVTAWLGRGRSANATLLTAADTLMTNLQTDGIKSKIRRLNLFMGDNIGSVLDPLIGSGSDTAGGSLAYGDYSQAEGLVSLSSTRYVNTGVSDGAGAAGHFWVDTSAATGTAQVMGATEPPNNRYATVASGVPYFFAIWMASGGPPIIDTTNPAVLGLYHIEHLGAGANQLRYFTQGTFRQAGTAAFPAAGLSCFVGCYNISGSPTGAGSGNYGLYGMTDGTFSDADAANLNTRLSTFLTAIGRS